MPEKETQVVEDKSMSQSETQAKARRKILRTLVAGGGALTAAKLTSEDWVKPMVESVVLPAHAQTSTVGPAGNFTSGTIPVAQVFPDSDSLLAEQPLSDELLEFFMPSAQAQTCSNVSCDVEFRLNIAADFSGGSVCVLGDSTGSSALNGVSATEFGGADMLVGDFVVGMGAFAGGTWSMKVTNTATSNSSTTVILSSGGVGCAT